ncbi:MAG: hypothetical protein HND55_03900 [Pseudomonadota bacterium]|nr:MAG: hypothetical protein HND55_03900 [Pseudomonadota bacterium]
MLVVSLAMLLGACASSRPAPEEPERYDVRHEGNRIVYRGEMSGLAIEEVAGLLEQHGDMIEWLDIESPGGEVMWGLDLGELVLEHELKVRAFNTGCHSTCANYVFTAGRERAIEDGALVTWHGSALQRNLSMRDGRPLKPSLRQYVQEWKERQSEFFQRTGVDERITIVGQDLGCECTWALSAEDMARFGLEDVDVPDGYTETDISSISDNSHMRFLELPDDVFERIRPREDA